MDINAPTENQVLSFTAFKAAKDATTSEGRLTPELFEAAGIPVAVQPPSRGDDLVPDQVISKSEVLRQGAEAMARLSSNRNRDWADWCKVLAALGIGRHAAMLEARVNKPRGRGYCTAFAKWLRCHEAFEAIDQADRKRMFDCLDNLGPIEEWRAKLAPSQQLRWNYPPTVLREWKRSRRPAPITGSNPPAAEAPAIALLNPTELRRQLEILGLSRFRQEVMPEDWRTPLSDTALSLASPDHLIAMLERKLSPYKTAGVALKRLRKSLRPTA